MLTQQPGTLAHPILSGQAGRCGRSCIIAQVLLLLVTSHLTQFLLHRGLCEAASKEPSSLLPSGLYHSAKILSNSAVLCLVAQSCLTLCDTVDSSPPGSFVHGDSPGKNTRVGCHALLQGISPGIKLRSPTLHAASLQSEPPGQLKNIGVDSLSFLQGAFPAQESNQDLLHCRWILCQLSYQGSQQRGRKPQGLGITGNSLLLPRGRLN